MAESTGTIQVAGSTGSRINIIVGSRINRDSSGSRIYRMKTVQVAGPTETVQIAGPPETGPGCRIKRNS